LILLLFQFLENPIVGEVTTLATATTFSEYIEDLKALIGIILDYGIKFALNMY